MKRLLLGPAVLALPLALFGCNWGTKAPELPKVPEVIREIPLEDFDHFPPVVPPAPVEAPVVRHKPAKTHQPVKKHVRPTPARPSPVVPVETPDAGEALPPQHGVICIFPFNMIPNCTPGVP
jgi:hypothetical protein